MKKLKKPKLPAKRPKFAKPKLPPQIKGKLKRGKSADEKVSEALSNVPRITNETVAGHREEVLSSARKYIYPLQHSKHSIVRISLGLFVGVIVVFFVAMGFSLYKFQNTSTFVYDVTRIIPFPVAKAGHRWVSYESYLFELRRNMHYYQTQQQANFKTKDGKAQLARLKQQAISQVIEDAYVKDLASQQHVSVSDQAVTNEVDTVRAESRLGSSDHYLKEVLNEFWGWDESDFRRELKQQLLQQAVVAKLDTAAQAKAESALHQLQQGTDFATLAGQVSEDPATKASGGQYPTAITLNTRELAPAIPVALFKLQPGQTSAVVNSGYTLEILKVLDKTDKSLHAAHIQFNLANIKQYTDPLQKQTPSHRYISI
jgi:parvulin-like peptidyl-prolyl isomerase